MQVVMQFLVELYSHALKLSFPWILGWQCVGLHVTWTVPLICFHNFADAIQCSTVITKVISLLSYCSMPSFLAYNMEALWQEFGWHSVGGQQSSFLLKHIENDFCVVNQGLAAACILKEICTMWICNLPSAWSCQCQFTHYCLCFFQ